MSELHPSDTPSDFEPVEVQSEGVSSLLGMQMGRRGLLRAAGMAIAAGLATAACGESGYVDDFGPYRREMADAVPTGPEYHTVSDAEWQAAANLADNNTRQFSVRLSDQAGTLYIYKGQNAAALYNTQHGVFGPGININFDGFQMVTLSKQALLPPANSPNAPADTRLNYTAQYILPAFSGNRISVGQIVRNANAPLFTVNYVDDGQNGGVTLRRNDDATVNPVVAEGVSPTVVDIHRQVELATDHIAQVARRLGLG